MTVAQTPLAKWFDRFSAFAVLALVILLAYSLAKFTWFLVVGDQGAVVSSDSMQVVSTSQESSEGYQVNIRQLQSWHLFGEVGNEPKPTEVVDAPIIDTSLRLELEGVFVAPDPKNSSAIISESNREGIYYKVGDKLPQNATLESVHSDKVVLKRNGRLEQLKFPEVSGAMSAAKSSVADRQARSSSRRYSTRASNRQSGDALKSRVGSLFQGGGIPQPAQVIESLNQDVQSNVEGLMDEMGVETVPLEDGGGVRITRQAPAEIKQMLGLRDGDVIKSVNGQMLGNTSDIQGLVQQYAQGGECQAQIELQRGSRIFTVNLDVCSGSLF